MDYSTPGFPVLHCLLEFAQIHVYWVGDAIWTLHPLPPTSTFCLLSFPASGYFPKSQLFTSGSQSIGAATSASVLPVNIQSWFPLGLTDLLAVQGTLRSLLQPHSSKTSGLQLLSPKRWENWAVNASCPKPQLVRLLESVLLTSVLLCLCVNNLCDKQKRLFSLFLSQPCDRR